MTTPHQSDHAAGTGGGTPREHVPNNYRLAEEIFAKVTQWGVDKLRVHPTDIYQIIQQFPNPELTAAIRRVTELEAKLARLPADWTQDSSLETWFPYTAKELPALRAIFPRILESLKSGGCSPNCSVEFLEKIPDEVSAVVSGLTAERDAALRERDELRIRLSKLAPQPPADSGANPA